MTTRDSLQQRYLIFAGAAAVRLGLAIAFPALPDFLSGRVEIATPVTGFKRRMAIHHNHTEYITYYIVVQEGLFLYNHGVSPYDGGVFHQAPLLLSFFSLFPDIARSPVPTVAVYALLDIMSANALIQTTTSDAAVASSSFISPRRDRKWTSTAVAARLVKQMCFF